MFLSSHFIDFIEVTPEMALKIAFAKQWWHDSSAKISEHLYSVYEAVRGAPAWG
jgi:hypothetical protein